MGRKNKQVAQIAERPKATKKCNWCRLPVEEGDWWDGQWLCDSCFPHDAMQKKVAEARHAWEEQKKLNPEKACEYKPKQSKEHRNKYANFSKFDHHQAGHGHAVIRQKPKRKEKKPKLKQIIHWVVVITDISDGKL